MTDTTAGPGNNTTSGTDATTDSSVADNTSPTGNSGEGVLCMHCTALCCRYVAVPIDEPTSKKDFDEIRWFLIHENITVFVEDDEWYICFHTPCKHLRKDHMCGIYETRPQVCRKYTTVGCDYHSGPQYGFDHLFTCEDEIVEFEKEYLGKKKKKNT